MSKAIDYLRSKEWSMGNGQCPECHGTHEGWFPHPCYMTPDTIGHKTDCPLANAIKDGGGRVLFIGDFKSDKKYRTGWSECGAYIIKDADEPLNDVEIEHKKKIDGIFEDAQRNLVARILEKNNEEFSRGSGE